VVSTIDTNKNIELVLNIQNSEYIYSISVFSKIMIIADLI